MLPMPQSIRVNLVFRGALEVIQATLSFGLESLLDQHSMSQFNGQMSIVSV